MSDGENAAQSAGRPSVDRYRLIVTDVDGKEHEVRGSILSTPGARLNSIIKRSAHELCALTDQGQFFVAKDHVRNIDVQSFISAAQRMNESIFLPYIVTSMATIREINETAASRAASIASNGAGDDETQMQRELIKIIQDGFERGATDVHIIDKIDFALINMRVNGSIQKTRDLQSPVARTLMSSAFAASEDSDSSYQDLEPQEARISRNNKQIRIPAGLESIRLHWNPLAYGGRSLAMRLQYSSVRRNEKVTRSIESLGYHKLQLEQLRTMRSKTSGVTIISGPTGSGKSTTLKVALEELMAETQYEKNALTIEDPPEYPINGVLQIPVTNVKDKAEREHKFQEAINAALRSDPDIIMIGEVRNRESAKLAFEAAMSGHLVFTTLHANSALAIIDRLRDIGVEPYKLYDPTILSGLVGQRLVPRLCPHCRIPFRKAVQTKAVSAGLLARLNHFLDESSADPSHVYMRGPGCAHCDKGHKEQVIATETIAPDETFMDLLRSERKVDARAYWYEQLGGFTMLTHALTKMLDGEVSPVAVESRVDRIIYDKHMQPFLCPSEKKTAPEHP